MRLTKELLAPVFALAMLGGCLAEPSKERSDFHALSDYPQSGSEDQGVYRSIESQVFPGPYHRDVEVCLFVTSDAVNRNGNARLRLVNEYLKKSVTALRGENGVTEAMAYGSNLYNEACQHTATPRACLRMVPLMAKRCADDLFNPRL